MPHIALNSAEPGIRGLLRFRPETGRPLSDLAEVLLRGPSFRPVPPRSCRRAWSWWRRSVLIPPLRPSQQS